MCQLNFKQGPGSYVLICLTQSAAASMILTRNQAAMSRKMAVEDKNIQNIFAKTTQTATYKRQTSNGDVTFQTIIPADS